MKPVSLLFVIGLSATAVVTAGCPKNPPPEQAAPTPNADSAAAAQAEAERLAREEADRRAREEAERAARAREADEAAANARTTEEVRNMLAAMIHFDYDKSNIRSDDAGTLDQKVAILQANSNLRIRIHGHCDERGSDEYNLALGNRRAQAAKQYLVSHGIDGGRIETQSWGEERPLVDGHDESAWSQNRRDEFEIIGGGDALVRP
ncbi:MAG TPA: peptidoglycan-associated lipoprotein Pal [Gemmatimonadales bacterium]|jgi:peptidoglycan-associated lipoprotein|nr:peptidoglycan-associated lipoprotein Pal [Gemmatimonadales bacterium]